MESENLDDYLIAYQGNNIYDFDNNILLNFYPQRVLSMLNGIKTGSLLELGLGHGITTNLFTKAFKRHVVLDGSAAIINKFVDEYPEFKGEVIETYFENFETDEKFDVIIMGFILEHVDDPVAILKKYKKYLKTEGRLFIAVPNAEVLNRRIGIEAGLLDDIELLSPHDHILGHKRYYTVSSLQTDIKSAGYEISTLEGLYLKPLTTSQMLQLDLSDTILDALCKVGKNYPELCCGILAEVQGK
ncbi:type 12 methyltransferase [Psychrosphaera saromensis]|uniref:SAM-dependent methyltransferase n=1 Tax=Psychrosphaera saromensis TaxID=716813 RepID=A0A2S7UUZ6_9GAMM|nr:methyltransferase domain-containing protein [Psychrosphaera saromensis]PQJ53816.1 SAM-dependent methyltransferase [Psychrosphaera saromensis]GHB62128.1 type 12 methyltransferase [Psychrosphaera saromensis]GLQ15393.1 type 12 methyltransferase [Psychrosphaera saromensis]